MDSNNIFPKEKGTRRVAWVIFLQISLMASTIEDTQIRTATSDFILLWCIVSEGNTALQTGREEDLVHVVVNTLVCKWGFLTGERLHSETLSLEFSYQLYSNPLVHPGSCVVLTTHSNLKCAGLIW